MLTVMSTTRIKYIFKTFVLCFFVFALNIGTTIPAYADPSIAITGSLPPKASDFQLSAANDATGTVGQNTTITFTVTYGSHLYYAGQLTVEAHWGQGTISGASSPSVDGLDYVGGSATNAYGNTAPIVDLVNQKIDWQISSFPSQTTNQTVVFSLKTNASYTGSNSVTFPTSFTIITPSFTTSAQTLSISYQYNPALVTPGPTATPTPAPSVTPTPIPTSTFSFTDINFRSVSPTSISLEMTTNKDAIVTAHFGLSPTALINQLTTETYATDHIIVLDNLSQNTTYYVQLAAQTPGGLTTTSDMYVFHTGLLSEIPQIDLSSLTYIAHDIILFAGNEQVTLTPGKVTGFTFEQPVVVIPQQLIYTIRFRISNTQTIKRIEAILRNKNVLGITSDMSEEPNTQSTDLILTPDGYFQGRLKAPSLEGVYEEFIRVYDTSGNITEQKIADIHVSLPIRIVGSKNQPVEAAQVTIYYQDPLTHTFQLLPPQIYPVKNPAFTDPNGEISVPLPAGTYKLHITALGYEPKDTTFTLSLKPNEAYPTIPLTSQPFSLTTTATYYTTIALDTLSDTKQYLLALAHSMRFFELNALIVTTLLVLLTFFALISRLRIPLAHLPSYLTHLFTRKQHTNMIKGKLMDENNSPIAGASIYLLNTQTTRILSHTVSSQDGTFVCSHVPDKQYALEILADGFEQTVITEMTLNDSSSQEFVCTLKIRQSPLAIGAHVMQFGSRILSVGFEFLLILSLIAEVAIGYTLGWEKASVFLVFSFANLCLWIFHRVQTFVGTVKN